MKNAGRKNWASTAHAKEPKHAVKANSRVWLISVTVRLRNPTMVERKAMAIGFAMFLLARSINPWGASPAAASLLISLAA